MEEQHLKGTYGTDDVNLELRDIVCIETELYHQRERKQTSPAPHVFPLLCF